MRKHSIRFRDTVRAGDDQIIREIVASTGVFSDAEVDIAAELMTERLLKGPESGYWFLFAEIDGRAIGYSCFGPIPATRFSYDLYWIAVHSDRQGEGTGKKLLEDTEDAIKRLGGRRIYVETSGREQYEPTRAFYISCGYAEEAILLDFYAPGDAKHFFVKEI